MSNRSQEPKKPDPGEAGPPGSRIPDCPSCRSTTGSRLITLLALIALFVLLVVYNNERNFAQEIAYSVFLAYVDGKEVAEVKIVDGFEILGTYRDDDRQFRTTIPYHDPQLLNRLEEQRRARLRAARSRFRLSVSLSSSCRGCSASSSSGSCFARCRAPATAPSPSARAAPSATWTPARRSASPTSQARKKPSTSWRKWWEFLSNPAKFSRIGAKIPKGGAAGRDARNRQDPAGQGDRR